MVDESGLDSQPSSATRITELGTSENSRIIDLGNNDNPLRVNELATNYIESGESFDRRATIVDTYFSEQIADIPNHPDPRTNGRKQSKQRLPRLIKEKYSQK